MISKKYKKIIEDINNSNIFLSKIESRDYQIKVLESLETKCTTINSPRQSGATLIGIMWIINLLEKDNIKIGMSTYNNDKYKQIIEKIYSILKYKNMPFNNSTISKYEPYKEYDYIFVDDYKTNNPFISSNNKARLLISLFDYGVKLNSKRYNNIQVGWKEVPRYKDGVLMSNQDFKKETIKKYGDTKAYDMFGIPSIVKINNILIKTKNSKKMKDARIKPSELFDYLLDGLSVDDLVGIKGMLK